MSHDLADKTLFLETFGCQMNILDSELVLGQLARLGYRRTADRDGADLVLFNTCSVRDHAEQKVYSRLGELRPIKTARPDMILGVIGCQAQREGENLARRFPHVDLLCSPGELDRLPELIAAVASTRERAFALHGLQSRRSSTLDRAREHDALEALDLSRSFSPDASPIQAYVRVQRGCDKFCTYCVVPTVRGKERSRRPEHIVAEAQMLARAGCREVTLIGQTVNSYVQVDEAGTTVTFARLLERVAAVPGLVRVRFVTSYPGDFDEDILRVMADVPNVCPFLHIPAQSGSDRVLRAMRRQYTAADYYRLIDRAREIVSDVSIVGDFIVGFPGESDADFAASVEMVRRVRYKNSYIFKYSARPGTAAFRNQPDDVPEPVKRERNRILLDEQEAVCQQLNRELLGMTVQVLVEGPSKLAADGSTAVARGQLAGRTQADRIVVFDPPPGAEPASLVGSLCEVRVREINPYSVVGELVAVAAPLSAPRPAVTPLGYKGLTVLR
ncbi:MAG: tRNA-2-methylthio-N(6)-dimethylallyladenosine synthase [Phycisphaerae bacterium]|nr:tRNA-2-methylthio-N(6)-dimethylallyladenosine synthase [Phycisphaerae bacterium]